MHLIIKVLDIISKCQYRIRGGLIVIPAYSKGYDMTEILMPLLSHFRNLEQNHGKKGMLNSMLITPCEFINLFRKVKG